MSNGKKIGLEAAIVAPIALLFIYVHGRLLPVDHQYRVLVPIFASILLLTRRDIPLIVKLKNNLWAIIPACFLGFWARGSSALTGIGLGITFSGIFIIGSYCMGLLRDRMARNLTVLGKPALKAND